MENRKPFAETLQGLLDERGWSQRELARRLEAEFGREKIAHSTIRLYMIGDMHPTGFAMERIAKCMRIDPDTFAEHRLETVRDQLNYRTRGTQKALRSLDRLRG